MEDKGVSQPLDRDGGDLRNLDVVSDELVEV
jgi:hypothetical protein